jgi:hypothetical protein
MVGLVFSTDSVGKANFCPTLEMLRQIWPRMEGPAYKNVKYVVTVLIIVVQHNYLFFDKFFNFCVNS